MSRLLIIISTLIVAAYGSGQLSIVQSPKSVLFKGSEKLESKSLGDVFAASLGYSVEHTSEWKGLFIADPFNTASGVVALVVDGIDKLRVDKATTYELTGTGSQESLDSLLYRVRSAVDFDLTQGVDALDQFSSVLTDVKTPSDKSVTALKPQLYAEDRLFLDQLDAITALTDKLQSIDELPAFLTVRLSLAPLFAAHQESPAATTEALKLLSAAVEQLSLAAAKAYSRNVLVAIVALKEDTIVRNKRSVTSRASDLITTEIREELNLAKNYEESYPVMFNIILWFGVIMVFTLLAISYTIGYMDPGRDSIIYRMTSTRMKKDN